MSKSCNIQHSCTAELYSINLAKCVECSHMSNVSESSKGLQRGIGTGEFPWEFMQVAATQHWWVTWIPMANRLPQCPLQSSWALADIAHVRAANISSMQVEVRDSGCCQSSSMHFHAAKLSVKQSPVIAQLGTNNLMKTSLIHTVLGVTAKNNTSHIQYTHVHLIYRQLHKTLCTWVQVLCFQITVWSPFIGMHATVHSSFHPFALSVC